MKKKAVLMVLAAALVVVASVGGTLAYLTAQTGTVTNTFSVGNITMTLDEANLNGPGRTTTGQTGYKIVPGQVIAKDPMVTIEQGSEKCYVFVKINNELKLTINSVATIVGTPNIGTEWKLVSGNIYVYSDGTNPVEVDASSVDKELQVFTNVTIDGQNVTSTNINGLNNKTIKVTAYAHQSENVTYDTAKTAAETYFATIG